MNANFLFYFYSVSKWCFFFSAKKSFFFFFVRISQLMIVIKLAQIFFCDFWFFTFQYLHVLIAIIISSLNNSFKDESRRQYL